MKTRDMEIALATYFDERANLVVPRVSWGLLNHEADMLVLSGCGYAKEIEIKISKTDFIKDFHKKHTHKDRLVKSFYFAVPVAMLDYVMERKPTYAGLLVVDETLPYWKAVKLIATAEINSDAKKFTEEERYQLARLGNMRYWSYRIQEQRREKNGKIDMA
jgi:hypothetical protein